jgi:Helix-turn-helix domain
MPEIGASLREARLRAKVDITDVEAATKIRAKYLRALENEEWGLLPGPAFVKSFLRTYADYLGLDGKLLVDEYKLRHERPSDIDQMPIAPNLGRRRAPGPVSRISPAWIIGIVIVALLVTFAVIGASGNDNNNSTPNTTSNQTKAQKAAEAKRKAAAAVAARRARIRRQRVKLQITPTAGVFVCLENAKGRALIPGVILQPGSNTRTFSSKRFRITLGNSSVTLNINGKPFTPPDIGTSISYLITKKKRQQLPAGTGPSCQGGTGTGTTTTGTTTGP